MTVKTFSLILAALILVAALAACGDPAMDHHPHDDADAHEAEAGEGPNGGRLLTDGDFAIELQIFESGVPPEYRAWPTQNGQPLPLSTVDLEVRLERLGDPSDVIGFEARGDYLRGDTVVYEPHSFAVEVTAKHGGEVHEWRYESFEGRTRIEPEVADAFGLATEQAGGATIRQTLEVYGQIVALPGQVSRVTARFDGELRSVNKSVGQRVAAGELLASVESNESLNVYRIVAPIDGVITERLGSAGEQTAGRVLFEITNTSEVWAELSVFPGDRQKIAVGMPVTVRVVGGNEEFAGRIEQLGVISASNQAIPARVRLDNPAGQLAPGVFVNAEIEIAVNEVPLAVRREGLQAFRDFTVVYAQVGDQYEVRMLELGRQDSEWVEVLGGLAPGTRYVTANSYLIKADVEKSGASHDH